MKPDGAAHAIHLKGVIYNSELDAGRLLARASAERSCAALATIQKDTESALSAAGRAGA